MSAPRYIVMPTREGDHGIMDTVAGKWSGWSSSIVKARAIAKRLNAEANK